MKTLEWNNKDKSSWGPGPWQDEPDKMQFTDEETGLPCLIVRNNGGALCGYVGVSEDHPWHGLDYNSCPSVCGEDWCGHSPGSRIEVHGGLTFSDKCADTGDPSKHICHLPDEGEPDSVWWLGFDCAHLGDVSPAYDSMFNAEGSYKDVAYVKSEIRSLARQLSEAENTI